MDVPPGTRPYSYRGARMGLPGSSAASSSLSGWSCVYVSIHPCITGPPWGGTSLSAGSIMT